MANLLFICSKNQWRSPTAELLFKNHPFNKARSAGTSDKAKVRVNEKMIAWADVIFVMEYRHKQLLNKKFQEALADKSVEVLDIEDSYQFGDPGLIEILEAALSGYL